MIANDPVIDTAQRLLDRIREDTGGNPKRVVQSIVIAVVIDDDGDKGLDVVTSGDMESWEKRGILAEILDDYSAQNVGYWCGLDGED